MLIWTNAEVHEFIDLYKNEPILWHPHHKDRKSKKDVIDAWIRIQQNITLECTVQDLKRKKESLMTSFRIHIHRKKSDPNYKPSWFCFEQMESFLGEKYECAPLKEESDSSILDSYFEDLDTTQGLHTVKIKHERIPNKRQRVTNSNDDIFATEINDDSYVRIDNDDECDVYCRLLAIKLRRFDEEDRDLLMHEIDNIIFKAKMKKKQESRKMNKSRSRQNANSTVFINLPNENIDHDTNSE